MSVKFMLAILPIIVLVVSTFIVSVLWMQPIYLPLMFATITASLVVIVGFKRSYKDVERFIGNSVGKLVVAILILLLIGVLSGAFMLSGIVASLMYYTAELISVEWFLPAVMVVCAVVSISLGSSVTTMATVGVALVLTGEMMGFAPELVIGAVISGAMFGDKLSPLSDTTNIAAMLSGTDLFKHIKTMLLDTVIAFLLTLGLFWWIGNNVEISDAAIGIEKMQVFLSEIFNISWLLAVIPFLMIPVAYFKPPVVPTIICFSVLACVLAVVVQDVLISELLLSVATKVSVLDASGAPVMMLSRGGLETMLPTIAIIICSGSFGGIMHEGGLFDVILDPFECFLSSAKRLVISSVLFSSFIALASGEQYLSVVLPSQTFRSKFEKLGVASQQLSRATESGGTVVSSIVPWGVIPAIAGSIFGVSPVVFIPFVFFGFLTPIVTIVRVLCQSEVSLHKESDVGYE